MTKITPYLEGYNAGLDGALWPDNPWISGCSEHKEWEEGRTEAERQQSEQDDETEVDDSLELEPWEKEYEEDDEDE
jgi:hypothetical protein